MNYPKKIMSMTALTEMGFPEPFLRKAYADPKQEFAWKSDATKKNSPILYDTEGLEKYRLEKIRLEKIANRHLQVV